MFIINLGDLMGSVLKDTVYGMFIACGNLWPWIY